MKKLLKVVVVIVFMAMIAGCCGGRIDDRVIYRGHKWDLVRVDNEIIAMPGLNAGKEATPVVLKSDKEIKQYIDGNYGN